MENKSNEIEYIPLNNKKPWYKRIFHKKCCKLYNRTLDITHSCIFCKTYIKT